MSLMMTVLPLPMWMPPELAFMSMISPWAFTGQDVSRSARFFVTWLRRTVRLPESTKIPPPSENLPIPLGRVWFADTSVDFSVRVPSSLKMPPPLASLMAPSARLSRTVLRFRVSWPEFAMPPPRARANGQKPSGHRTPLGESDTLVAVARLSATVTSVNVTLAPTPPSAVGSMSMPPPRESTPSPVATPPVTASCEIATFRWGVVPAIVMTGPPPRITVRPCPAPTTRTLLRIVTPPA